MDRSAKYEALMRMRTTLPPQRSPEWYAQRYGSGNSSQYQYMFNVGGSRDRELIAVSKKTPPSTSVPMSWGTLVENISGYLFSIETGLQYEEIGSIPHHSFPQIRGSLDGFGQDDEGHLFALETKSPVSRIPCGYLSEITYLYQVLQNIEISDADYGLFNDVRLLPCTTEDVLDRECARDMVRGITMFCRYAKYGEVAEPSRREDKGRYSVNKSFRRVGAKIVAVKVYRNSPDDVKTPLSATTAKTSEECPIVNGTETLVEGEKRESPSTPWLGNIFNAYTGNREEFTMRDLFHLITGLLISFVPIGYCTSIGEDAREWSETMIAVASQDPLSIGYAFFKVDVHSVRVVPRDSGFWYDHLRPMAIRWVDDIHAIEEGRMPSRVPSVWKEDLPRPSWFETY